MSLTRFFRAKWMARRRSRLLPPAVESLEDRCLLSAGFAQVNLVSDVPGLARLTNPALANPWGVSFSPTGPFWFADNASGVSNVLNGLGQPFSLVVSLPPSSPGTLGTPTGTVFNAGTGFDISENGVTSPASFLFATLNGTIAAWNGLVDQNHALVAVNNSASGAAYTGLALASTGTRQTYLYAADFTHGTIDVFNQNFQQVTLAGSFRDPNLPRGYAPFNIAEIGDQLYVTYAKVADAAGDEADGPGLGFVDVFDNSGTFVRRLASQGALNAPWGLALAPAGFGPYGGDLLVGNNGDGTIAVFNPQSGAYLGEPKNGQGQTIQIANLWSLTFGNGHVGGDAETLFFTSGMANEEHGLFGAIQAPGRQGLTTEGPGAFDPNAPGEAGDYPLPPLAGPSLSNPAGDRPLTADLLPPDDSSLVLIPTLSGLSPDGSSDSATLTAIVTAALSPVNSNAAPLAIGADSRTASPPVENSLPLNQFLNVDAQASASQAQTGSQVRGNRPANDARPVVSAQTDAPEDVSVLDSFFASLASSAAILLQSSQ
jgi:uncharacterized protein (TIGR03118 family)